MWGRMEVLFVGGVVIFLWGVVEIGENSPIKRPKNTKFRLKIGVERVPPAFPWGFLSLSFENTKPKKRKTD